jgi:rubredoxin
MNADGTAAAIATAEGRDMSSLECGICWFVYDPVEGDPVSQVRPGTSFDELPEHWCCPNCDAPKFKFMRLER